MKGVDAMCDSQLMYSTVLTVPVFPVDPHVLDNVSLTISSATVSIRTTRNNDDQHQIIMYPSEKKNMNTSEL